MRRGEDKQYTCGFILRVENGLLIWIRMGQHCLNMQHWDDK